MELIRGKVIFLSGTAFQLISIAILVYPLFPFFLFSVPLFGYSVLESITHGSAQAIKGLILFFAITGYLGLVASTLKYRNIFILVSICGGVYVLVMVRSNIPMSDAEFFTPIIISTAHIALNIINIVSRYSGNKSITNRCSTSRFAPWTVFKSRLYGLLRKVFHKATT